MRKFKDVALTFDMRNLPAYDQEYLRTMFYETVMNRSVRDTGISFDMYYEYAMNFTLFASERAMGEGMSEFNDPYAYTASHLLDGRKYWLAWTYDYDAFNELVTI
jgi:hypothetical protein